MTTNATSPFKLSIDKISILANAFGPDEINDACSRLIAIADSAPHRVKLKSSNRYRLQATFQIGGSGTLFIQVGPRFSGIRDYRIEFNPSKLDQDGLDEVQAIVEEITHIPFRDFVASGKVTRIDVALDLPTLTLEDVVIRSKGQKSFGAFTDGKGILKNAYLGDPKANRSSCYTKKTKGQRPFLRIERQLKPGCPGSGVTLLPNPFEKIDMVSTSTIEPYLDQIGPKYFFDRVRLRGIGRVLEEFPAKERKVILAALKDPTKTMLPPMDLIWQRWPYVVLESLGGGEQHNPKAGHAAWPQGTHCPTIRQKLNPRNQITPGVIVMGN
ncbi:hypothetical protein FNL56_27100 [Tardiphaga sp. vice304]|uniref:hypothetical protein n=1 Tax=Tardiphaga sp. vice304 TaxID=2592817 RepID=UPI001165A568|nr:hypothetical protein [Tardiphaga sp. vice304]QDM29366.1 hypothetical protein FNL56_27100 [Tardiphaga sp. vice304]